MLSNGVTILFKIDESRRRKRRQMTEKQLREEGKRKFNPKIPSYQMSLFNSMFKNW